MTDFIVSFDSRGREIVDSTPFELSTNLGRPPRETIEDKIRRMVMQQQMNQNDTIRDEADLMEDLNDFSDDDSDQNLISDNTPYTVSDDVPDTFSASEYRASKTAQKKTTDSPNTGSSAPSDTAGVAGE